MDLHKKYLLGSNPSSAVKNIIQILDKTKIPELLKRRMEQEQASRKKTNAC